MCFPSSNYRELRARTELLAFHAEAHGTNNYSNLGLFKKTYNVTYICDLLQCAHEEMFPFTPRLESQGGLSGGSAHARCRVRLCLDYF